MSLSDVAMCALFVTEADEAIVTWRDVTARHWHERPHRLTVRVDLDQHSWWRSLEPEDMRYVISVWAACGVVGATFHGEHSPTQPT